MKKRVVQLARADADVDTAIESYAGEPELAEELLRALDEALGRIAELPGSGSPRHGHALGVEGLRSVPITRFPYTLFYVEHATAVVVRIFHQRRDLPELLDEDD